MSDFLSRLRRPKPQAAQAQTGGRSLVVWGPEGSTGRSAIAANIAAELALSGFRVLLIDADTYAPSQTTLFGVTDAGAGIAAACRLVGQQRLDKEQIDRLSNAFEFGRGALSLLGGLGSANRWPELSADKITQLIAIGKQLFDYVVVDVASALEDGIRQIGGVSDRNGAARAGIACADKVIAVALADASGVQRFMVSLEGLRELTANNLTLINRLRGSVLGADARRQIADTLSRFAGIEVDGWIPEDSSAFDLAAFQEVPLALAKRNSAARQAIAEFVRLQILELSGPLQSRVAKLG